MLEKASLFPAANAPASFTFDVGTKYYGPLKDGKPNGMGVYTLPNGKVLYVGDWEKGLATCRGILFCKNGVQYRGAVDERGTAHGHGVMYFANGDHYEGDFVNGMHQGRGTMNYAFGDQYVGEWENGLFHGFGTYTWHAGDKYQGKWVKEQQTGFGTYRFADGCKIVGHWVDNKQHGRGVKTDANGQVVHNGMWENGNPVTGNNISISKLEGSCCFCLKHFAEGQPIAVTGCQHLFHKDCLCEWLKKGNTTCPRCHTGGLCLPVSVTVEATATDAAANTSSSNTATDTAPVAHDAPVGRITDTDSRDNATTNTGTDNADSNEAEAFFPAANASFTFYDGTKYYGPLKDEKPHGIGAHTSPSGKILYVGDWEKGFYSGRGVLFSKNGDQYQGAFERGDANGHCVTYFANGDHYEGDFFNSMRQGWGTMNYANGDHYFGEYENCLYHGFGTYTWRNGDKYQGKWIKGQRTGFGTLSTADGCKIVGRWIGNIQHGRGVKTDASGNVIHNGIWENGYPVTGNNISMTKLEGSCCFCLEQFANGQPIAVTGCQHLFHKDCLAEWLKKGNTTCPYCRTGALCLPVSVTDDSTVADAAANTSSSNAATVTAPVAHDAPAGRITDNNSRDNATTSTGPDSAASNEATGSTQSTSSTV